ASVTSPGTSAIFNPGPHGLSEMLYAFSSMTGNNGSAFAGLGTTTVGNPSFVYYNWAGGVAMLVGRFAFIVPVMALAGALVRKKVVPAGPGTFPTTQPLFAGLVVGVIVIVGALTFFPALALGPIVEQLLMLAGKLF
ncbi:MAG: potassium-transporting ATPase subunit KdpA, partial [Ktedonobacterales bacterium]